MKTPVASINRCTSSRSVEPVPVCAIGESTVQIDADFAKEMLQLLEEESPYAEIIEQIESAPLTQRVIISGDSKYRIREHSLCIH